MVIRINRLSFPPDLISRCGKYNSPRSNMRWQNVKSKLFRFFVFSFLAEAVFKRTRLTLFYALPLLSPVPLQTHLPFLGTVSEKYF